MKKLYHINKQIAFESILMIGYAFFFIRIIVNGNVNEYVHPRIIPFMIFAAVSWIVITAFRLGEIFRQQNTHRRVLPLVFFIVPLMMAYTIPPQPFDSNTRTLGEIQLSGENSGNTNRSLTDSLPENTTRESPEADDLLESDADRIDQPDRGVTEGDKTLVMDSDNFVDCLNDVYGDVESYTGMPIEVLGFVFHDQEQFEENEFVAARLMMVCCAADMQPVGFLCRYDGAHELESDAWITVSGTIEKTVYEEETIPYIKVEKVERATKPDYDYIYPY